MPDLSTRPYRGRPWYKSWGCRTKWPPVDITTHWPSSDIVRLVPVDLNSFKTMCHKTFELVDALGWGLFCLHYKAGGPGMFLIPKETKSRLLKMPQQKFKKERNVFILKIVVSCSKHAQGWGILYKWNLKGGRTSFDFPP